MSRVAWFLVLGMVVPLAAQPVHRIGGNELVQGSIRKLKRSQQIEITTPFGSRLIAAKEYAGIVPSDGQKGALDNDTIEKHSKGPDQGRTYLREQAELARQAGKLKRMRRLLNRLLSIDTDDQWARMTLANVAGRYRQHRSEGATKGRELRRYVDFLFEDLAVRDNVGAVLAAEKAKKLPTKSIYRNATKALKHGKPRVRWLGAHMLRSVEGKPERIQALYRLSLKDGVWAVRREAVRSLKNAGASAFVNLYAKQLDHPSDVVRLRAAGALGELGDRAAAAPLVKALAGAGRPRRTHIVSTTQRAYVKDYDVEVAATAFIADPIVDVIQDGSVLDVGIISISIVRGAYRSALRRVTGEDFGTSAKAWRRWLDESN